MTSITNRSDLFINVVSLGVKFLQDAKLIGADGTIADCLRLLGVVAKSVGDMQDQLLR